MKRREGSIPRNLNFMAGETRRPEEGKTMKGKKKMKKKSRRARQKRQRGDESVDLVWSGGGNGKPGEWPLGEGRKKNSLLISVPARGQIELLRIEKERKWERGISQQISTGRFRRKAYQGSLVRQ